MKKLIYLTCLLLVTALSSFSTTGNHSFSKLSANKFGTCGAPTNLIATVNGSQLTLKWISVPGVSTFSYGGYYNRTGTPSVVNFGGTTSGTQITITIQSGFLSGTFRVTSQCSDGTTSESLPKTF